MQQQSTSWPRSSFRLNSVAIPRKVFELHFYLRPQLTFRHGKWPALAVPSEGFQLISQDSTRLETRGILKVGVVQNI